MSPFVKQNTSSILLLLNASKLNRETMASKHSKKPLIPSYANVKSDISFPPIFAFSTSIGAFLLSEPLLSYSTKNPQSSITNLLIPLLLFILVPATFFTGMGLLIIRAAVPSDSPRGEIYADQINRLAKITVAVALASLLAGVAIGVYVVLPEAVDDWWFG